MTESTRIKFSHVWMPNVLPAWSGVMVIGVPSNPTIIFRLFTRYAISALVEERTVAFITIDPDAMVVSQLLQAMMRDPTEDGLVLHRALLSQAITYGDYRGDPGRALQYVHTYGQNKNLVILEKPDAHKVPIYKLFNAMKEVNSSFGTSFIVTSRVDPGLYDTRAPKLHSSKMYELCDVAFAMRWQEGHLPALVEAADEDVVEHVESALSGEKMLEAWMLKDAGHCATQGVLIDPKTMKPLKGRRLF